MINPNEVIVRIAEFEQMVIEAEGDLQTSCDELVLIDLNTPEGVDAAQLMLERTALVAESWAAKAKNAQRIAKQIDRANEMLKMQLKELMQNKGVTELEGADMLFKLTKSKAKLVIEDENKVIGTYEKIVREVDTARLREDLSLGVPVEGAKLEPTFALRQYPNKKVRAA